MFFAVEGKFFFLIFTVSFYINYSISVNWTWFLLHLFSFFTLWSLSGSCLCSSSVSSEMTQCFRTGHVCDYRGLTGFPLLPVPAWRGNRTENNHTSFTNTVVWFRGCVGGVVVVFFFFPHWASVVVHVPNDCGEKLETPLIMRGSHMSWASAVLWKHEVLGSSQ